MNSCIPQRCGSFFRQQPSSISYRSKIGSTQQVAQDMRRHAIRKEGERYLHQEIWPGSIASSA